MSSSQSEFFSDDKRIKFLAKATPSQIVDMLYKVVDEHEQQLAAIFNYFANIYGISQDEKQKTVFVSEPEEPTKVVSEQKKNVIVQRTEPIPVNKSADSTVPVEESKSTEFAEIPENIVILNKLFKFLKLPTMIGTPQNRALADTIIEQFTQHKAIKDNDKVKSTLRSIFNHPYSPDPLDLAAEVLIQDVLIELTPPSLLLPAYDALLILNGLREILKFPLLVHDEENISFAQQMMAGFLAHESVINNVEIKKFLRVIYLEGISNGLHKVLKFSLPEQPQAKISSAIANVIETVLFDVSAKIKIPKRKRIPEPEVYAVTSSVDDIKELDFSYPPKSDSELRKTRFREASILLLGSNEQARYVFSPQRMRFLESIIEQDAYKKISKGDLSNLFLDLSKLIQGRQKELSPLIKERQRLEELSGKKGEDTDEQTKIIEEQITQCKRKHNDLFENFFTAFRGIVFSADLTVRFGYLQQLICDLVYGLDIFHQEFFEKIKSETYVISNDRWDSAAAVALAQKNSHKSPVTITAVDEKHRDSKKPQTISQAPASFALPMPTKEIPSRMDFDTKTEVLVEYLLLEPANKPAEANPAEAKPPGKIDAKTQPETKVEACKVNVESKTIEQRSSESYFFDINELFARAEKYTYKYMNDIDKLKNIIILLSKVSIPDEKSENAAALSRINRIISPFNRAFDDKLVSVKIVSTELARISSLPNPTKQEVITALNDTLESVKKCKEQACSEYKKDDDNNAALLNNQFILMRQGMERLLAVELKDEKDKKSYLSKLVKSLIDTMNDFIDENESDNGVKQTVKANFIKDLPSDMQLKLRNMRDGLLSMIQKFMELYAYAYDATSNQGLTTKMLALYERLRLLNIEIDPANIRVIFLREFNLIVDEFKKLFPNILWNIMLNEDGRLQVSYVSNDEMYRQNVLEILIGGLRQLEILTSTVLLESNCFLLKREQTKATIRNNLRSILSLDLSRFRSDCALLKSVHTLITYDPTILFNKRFIDLGLPKPKPLLSGHAPLFKQSAVTAMHPRKPTPHELFVEWLNTATVKTHTKSTNNR